MRCLTIKQLSFVSQIGQLKVEESNYPYSTTGDVTILERSTDKTTVAGGYSSGELRIFNYITKEVVATFRGHRSAVSAVAFERSGSIVASGGRDSDIFLWDLVTLTGEIMLLIITASGQH
jgi:WD40 repeat protein